MLGQITLTNGQVYILSEDGKWQGKNKTFSGLLQSLYDPEKPQGVYVTMPFGLGALFHAGNKLGAKIESNIDVPKLPYDEKMEKTEENATPTPSHVAIHMPDGQVTGFKELIAAGADPEFIAAFDLAEAIANTDLNPTKNQIDAGNQKKGKFSWNGLRIAIENPKGTFRKKRTVPVAAHYGYFLGNEAVDGDNLDCFIGPNLDSDKVFVIDQNKVDSDEHDEKKCLIGFDSEEHAKQAYFDSYEPGFAEKIFDKMEEFTVDEFKAWLETAEFGISHEAARVRALKGWETRRHGKVDVDKVKQSDITVKGEEKPKQEKTMKAEKPLTTKKFNEQKKSEATKLQGSIAENVQGLRMEESATLPELFKKQQKNNPDLTIGEFQDAVRHAYKDGKVALGPYTRSYGVIAGDHESMFIDGQVMYYAYDPKV